MGFFSLSLLLSPFPIFLSFSQPYSHRITTDGVVERVRLLFGGDAELIQGFSFFLPPGFKIQPPKPIVPQNAADFESPAPVPAHAAVPALRPIVKRDFDSARDYVKRIKVRSSSVAIYFFP